MAKNWERYGRDRCVICWKPTPYIPSVPIEKRMYYVEGVGQLCPQCYKKMQETEKAKA